MGDEVGLPVLEMSLITCSRGTSLGRSFCPCGSCTLPYCCIGRRFQCHVHTDLQTGQEAVPGGVEKSGCIGHSGARSKMEALF